MANSQTFSERKRRFYEPLHCDVVGTQGLARMKESFVSSFLERVLHDGKSEEKDILYKCISLDTKKSRKKKGSHKKRKSLTSAQKKKLNLFKLSQEDIKFDLYLPLHELWKDYTRDLLNLDKINPRNQCEAERRFMKSDLHGSLIVVVKSKCPSLIGLSGIVLQETKHTFKIVTKSNQLKVLPKKGTVFSISLDDYVFTIYGSNFMFRSSDRASRNFKAKPIVDLA